MALSFSSPLPANEHLGLGVTPVEGAEVLFDGQKLEPLILGVDSRDTVRVVKAVGYFECFVCR